MSKVTFLVDIDALVNPEATAITIPSNSTLLLVSKSRAYYFYDEAYYSIIVASEAGQLWTVVKEEEVSWHD